MLKKNATPESQPLYLLQVARAVFWSFIGIRKGRDYDSDASRFTPAEVIFAGLIGAGVFIAVLVLVVYWVTHN